MRLAANSSYIIQCKGAASHSVASVARLAVMAGTQHMYPTIQAASEAIRAGDATPVDLLEQCLQRIDKYEAKVKAWVFVDENSVREQAQKLTAELKAGQNRGPLHGIPIGIKDVIDVRDWPT